MEYLIQNPVMMTIQTYCKMSLFSHQGIVKRESIRKQNYPQRSIKMEISIEDGISESTKDQNHRRKQMTPQRSLKQLSNVVEQVIDGHIQISPIMPWEMNTNLLEYCNRNDYTAVSASFLCKSQLCSDEYSFDGCEYGDDDLESAANLISSISNMKEGNTKSKSLKKISVLKPQTYTGNVIESDTDERGISHRKKIWEKMMSKRKSASGNGGGGSTSVGSARGVTPLDISDYAGSSLLDDEEFQLCSSLRLFPIQYFQSRKTLVGNYENNGFYKKSAAQKMLKIDVNKTGKLYDFFIQRHWMPLNPEDPVSPLRDERWLAIE